MIVLDVSEIYQKYSFVLTEEKLPVNKDIFLDEVGCLAKNFDEYLNSQPNLSCSPSSIVPKLAELIVSFGLVKTFDIQEDRDFDAKDFPTEASDAVECFEYLHYLMKQYRNIDTTGKRKFLVQVILLCATHNSTYFWSSEASVSSSKEFLEKMLKTTGHNSLSILLCDETFFPTLFKAVLKWLRPTLMKDTWWKNPSSCYIFHWLLTHVKHPHLSDYFWDIMPPPFMFANYFAIPQQIVGIKCFDHILDNVPPSLIKGSGVEEAIFDCLKKYIHVTKEVPIIEILYPCLLKLPMMNLRKVNHLEWLRFDDLLQKLLLYVDVECNPELRLLYLRQTYLFIKTTPCFKHLKKSISVLLPNFVTNSRAEEKCLVESLKILKELIRTCWPRMENHCFDITCAILKALYDVKYPSYSRENKLTEETASLCKECLELLKSACPKTFSNLIKEYSEEEDDPLIDVNMILKD